MAPSLVTVVRAALVAALGSAVLGQSPQDFEPLRFGDPEDLAYDVPYVEGATYDADVPTPDEILGQRHGTRLAHHAEIVECFRRWAEVSPRMQLQTYGRTHEGRELVYATVAAPRHLARIDAIRRQHARLADPRGLGDAEGEALLDETPPVAWMGYSIHGDELSGADAAVALGYHLVASTDADVAELLDDIVIVIDPVMNPDGRERIVSMVEQSAGYVPNLDDTSMQRGRWPWGRGNHYLFDLNRDWMTGVHPETRGRWHAVRGFHPQLFVDAHEMWAQDTYLFYPQADPHNPYLPATLDRWQTVFGGDQARAFDRHGWAYYTREWADAWAPFYSDAWGSTGGAIGILYEQSQTSGFPLRRDSGVIMTYRESVHHQLVSSLANLRSLQAHGREVLADYLAFRRAAVSADAPGNDRMFVMVPGRNAAREDRFVSLLLGQGIEVMRVDGELSVADAVDTLGGRHESLDLRPGSLVVSTRQPESARVKNYLSFEVRLDDETLLREREDLVREGTTRLYDATAWSLPLLFDLDGYWCAAEDVDGDLVTPPAPAAGRVLDATGADADAPPFAWIVDGDDDRSVAFAAAALEQGLAVHLSDEPFTSGGRAFARGSLLVRRADNEGDVAERTARAAAAAGVTVVTTTSGRSPDDGPDLGGGHFQLLERPRVAMLSNAPISTDTFGHLWHLLDREVGVPVSFLDAQHLGGYDLRRYNVLVVPPGYGLEGLLGAHAESLSAWISAGGTLVACGDAAAAVTSPDLELTSVVRRRDALEELEGFAFAARREIEARHVEVDPAVVWGDAPTDGGDAPATGDDADAGGDDASSTDSDAEPDVDPDLARRDEWMRRFSPAGAVVRGLVDGDAWLTVGSGEELPVQVAGDSVYLARSPARTAVRLATEDRLRLSGLLWPEARERLATSAWLTVESVGRGQVILFAAVPGYRGHCPSSGRLFANAVVYGPGAGASAPIDW